MEAELTSERIKLINILEELFQPAESAEPHPLHTTADIFKKLQSIYPSESYNEEDVVMVLFYKKYEIIPSNTGKMFWLIQEKL